MDSSEDELATYSSIRFESRNSIYGLYATHLDYQSSPSGSDIDITLDDIPKKSKPLVSVKENTFFDQLLPPKHFHALETANLLQKDRRKDTQGRILHEKVMRNFNYHRSSLSNIHIWWMVFVKSLNHLMRKYFEYFAYFLILPSSYLAIDSFFSFGICIASMDIAFILCQLLILPLNSNSTFFLNYYSPHHLQFLYQVLIALSMFIMLWWNTFAGIFILRFLFGIGYCLLLNNWSVCISLFISPSKQSSAVGKMELSWAFASFCFILIAYVMDVGGFNVVLYIFCISSVICSIVLLSIMPHVTNDTHELQQPYLLTIKERMKSIISFIFSKFICLLYLSSMILITFVNTMLTLLLAVWLTTDYYLSITEFGYCTVIIGTAQLVSILFSYQYRHKLGIGWSLLAGIIVQLCMFIVLLVFHNNGILSGWMISGEGDSAYTFPLLLMLLVLCIHFIAAEFTYINTVCAMIHFAPLNVSIVIAAQSLKIVTSVGRVFGAVLAAWVWYWGKFHLFVQISCICLGIAFCLYLVIMVYVACCLREEAELEDVRDVMEESSDLSFYQNETSSVVDEEDGWGRAMILQRNRNEEKNIRMKNQAVIIDEIEREVNMDVDMEMKMEKEFGGGGKNTTEIYMRKMMDASMEFKTSSVKII